MTNFPKLNPEVDASGPVLRIYPYRLTRCYEIVEWPEVVWDNFSRFVFLF